MVYKGIHLSSCLSETKLVAGDEHEISEIDEGDNNHGKNFEKDKKDKSDTGYCDVDLTNDDSMVDLLSKDTDDDKDDKDLLRNEEDDREEEGEKDEDGSRVPSSHGHAGF